MKKLFLWLLFVVLTLQNKAQTINDGDGNTYKTVTIGTQVWMKENLATTKLNDGTIIPNVTDISEWENLTTTAYCWLYNDPSNKPLYGALYNWYTVNTGKLCPAGWHVPADDEWRILRSYLGGESDAGGKLKTISGWALPNTEASNSSGFSALPGHMRSYSGWSSSESAYWWSSTEYDEDRSWYLSVWNTSGTAKIDAYEKVGGFSVRCLKNANEPTPVEIIDEETDIKIYPNPATKYVIIENNRAKEYSLKVINLQGHELLLKNIELSGPYRIDLSGLSNGAYLMILQNKKERIIKRFFIQN